MLADRSHSITPVGVSIDWSNLYSTRIAKGAAEELARCAAIGSSDEDEAAEAEAAEAAQAAVKVTGRNRLLMTQKDKAAEEKAKCVIAETRAREKGCGRQTFNDLVCMAKNYRDFVELCANEAGKRAGHVNLRKQFNHARFLDRAERGPFSQVETAAWTNRPQGCSDLKEALLLYSKELNKRLEIERNEVGAQALSAESDAALAAVENLKTMAAKSNTRYWFPEAGGFIEQQKATAAFRAYENRRIMRGAKRMTEAQKYEEWPCLQPGWPDDMQGRLTSEEIQIRHLESGKRGLQCPDAPATHKKARAAVPATDSSLPPRAPSPSLTLPLASKPPSAEVPSDVDEDDIVIADMLDVSALKPHRLDRRFDAEPARVAAVTTAEPGLVQAYGDLSSLAPHDLSAFDPAEVAAYKKTVVLFDPKTRRPRTPTVKDLLAKGLKPMLPGAPQVPAAPSAKALGKRPMK